MIKLLLRDVSIVELMLGVVVVGLMARSRRLATFPTVVGWLGVNSLSVLVSTVMFFFRSYTNLTKQQAYDAYFYCNWISFAILSCLQLLIVYNVFNEAMRPFEGLQKIGRLIFMWGGVVCAAMTLAFCAGPELGSSTLVHIDVMQHIATRMTQCVSILTVCLLVFVGFATRPLGLNFRSRLFGVTLGLGVVATTNLITAAWFPWVKDHSVYSPVNLIGALGYSATLLVWGTYFALPEPEARLILLPTTSPFFHWNRISEILGDSPGNVAIAGLTPEMLAPAEIAMMEAALPSRSSQREAGEFGAFSPSFDAGIY